MQLGIVAALPMEARCLLGRRLRPGARAALENNTGWIQLSGMGPQNARQAAQSLLASGATALMSWGVAAGLDPQLHRGDLVLAKAVVTAAGKLIVVDPAWHARFYASLPTTLKTSTENIAETPIALINASDKVALRQRTGAVAADMESAAIGAVAQQAGVPFLVIRVVLDGQTVTLPQAAIAAMEMDGKFHALRLLKALVRHPAQIIALLPLALGSQAATTTLTQVAKLAGSCLQVKAKI